MLKRILFFIIILFTQTPSFASHIIGNDFTYQYLGNNVYRFTLSIYRDCRPQSQGGGSPSALSNDNPAYITIFAGNSFINFDSVYKLSSIIVPVEFSNDCINNIPFKCSDRIRFTFNRTLPPNNTGYTLVYQRCCRNGSTLNLNNPGTTGASFVCTIPPQPIVGNSSAVFIKDPPQIVCINNPLKYDNSATDADGDSLSYELCAAIRGGTENDPKPTSMSPPPYSQVSYSAPYTAFNPMPGNPAMFIDPITGLLTITPSLLGIYTISVCCTEWRNGIAINTTRREFQMEVTDCSKAVVANIPNLSQEPNTYIIKCDNFTVNFLNTSIGGFKYEWDFGDNSSNTDTSSLFSPTYTYPDTGTYKVRLWVNRGSTCPDSIEKWVKVYPEFHTEYSWSGNLCPYETINFFDQSTSSNYPVNYWFWNFENGSTSNSQNSSTSFENRTKTYHVQLISGNAIGCRDTATKSFELKYVNIDATQDTIVLVNTPVQLYVKGAANYIWSPNVFIDDPTSSNPTFIFPAVGQYTYIVSGTTDNGCPDSDTVTIYVTSEPYIFVPNAFSPDGDGLNDIARIIGAGFKKLNYFQIFNRWGQKVFSTTNFREGWDGKINGIAQPTSTFFWIADVVGLNDERKKFRGDITLVR